ncbi:MAG TPA: efflux transporter outer membrane subunit [Steroidobacteraceae bacterium]|nr:efflux transporter outer membrane subunit [Steroidobacteraceae bacterium]
MLACFGLAGCAAVGPDYTTPAAEVPAGWNRLDATTQPVARGEAPGDLSQWWEVLNDPLLSGLVNEALLGSPDLRSAQARLREARARRTVVASARFPSVTASGSASRSESSEEVGTGATRNFFRAGIDASWELDVFGGVRRGVEAAEADVEASRADLDATRVSLAAEVALSYIEVRAQQALLGIARANLDTQSETLQLTDWRAQAGLVSTQDVEQARSNREQTRAQIPALETSLAEAEHSLDFLLGRAPGTLHARLAAVGDLPAVPAQVAVGIPADTLRQRPDVRAAERSLAAETARVGVAEAARYPSFNLSGSIGLEALTFGALGNSGAATSSLFAGITAPIFDAGRRRAQVEIQDAVREQALVAYEQTVLVALQDVENALVELARNRERGEALTNAVDAARNAAELARQRYSVGLIDFQSVLDSERNVLLLEESLASNRANGVRALIRLYKALGGGWSPQAESSPASKDAS